MTPRCRSTRLLSCAALILAPLLVLAGCGGSDAKTAPAVPPPASPGVQILVTNDDGVSAPGLDILVTRLRSLSGVTVQVVAPAENQSGSGGKTKPGALPHESTTTASGFPATSVRGFPADTIRVALDDLSLRPALVVSGINKGQNIGPLVTISGTVGAARAAAQRGIPAIASSQGAPAEGTDYDYAVGADYTVREVEKMLPALGTPAASTSTIRNLNVPSCERGSVRGLRTPPPDTSVDGKPIFDPSDCTSAANPNDEINAFHDGFAVLTAVPATA